MEKKIIESDVVILGGGPAGLSAAIYTARAKLNTIVIDEMVVGGQVNTTYHVANYPGTNGVVSGLDLMENMRKQAIGFGAKLDEFKHVIGIDFKGDIKIIETEDTIYHTKSVIIATGAQPRKLPVEDEEKFRGKGVHYCATCDGALYQDSKVIVLGGGDAAVEEAVFLTKFTSDVTIISKYDKLKASKTAQEEVLNNDNINIIWNSQIRKLSGKNELSSVVIENTEINKLKEIEADAVFVYIGMVPKSELFKHEIEVDERGYIITDEDMNTNVTGVYAAGDIRQKSVRQIATAVGDGAIAGIMCEKYLTTMR